MTYAVAGAKRWVISAGLSAATLLGCGDGMAPEPAAGGRVAVDPIVGDHTPIEQADVGHDILAVPTPATGSAAQAELQPQEASSAPWSGAGLPPEVFPVEEAVFDLLRDLLEAEAREDLRYRALPRVLPMVGAGPCGDCRWGARIREQLASRLDDMPREIRPTLEAHDVVGVARAEVTDHAMVCDATGDCALIVEVEAIDGEGAIERMAGSLDRVRWRLSFVDEQSDPPSSHSWTLDLMPLGADDLLYGHAIEVQGMERPSATNNKARPSRPDGADGIDRPDAPTPGDDR